jgi:guanine nucleotide-binding protein subunit alpha
MQDAMTIWDSICHSQWFKSTSIVGTLEPGEMLLLIDCLKILFLNKDDLFQAKIQHSDIKTFFPVGLQLPWFVVTEACLMQDFDGEPRDANSGREYFKKRFARLAQKAGRQKEREIYIQSVARFVIVIVNAQTWSALPQRPTPRYCE